MSQMPSYGASIRNQSLYTRFLRARRYLDDHGMELPDARLRTTWPKSRIVLAVVAIVVTIVDGVLAASGHAGGVVFLLLPATIVIIAGALLSRRTEVLSWWAFVMALLYLIEKADGDPDIGATAIFAVLMLIVTELVFAASDRGTGVTWERRPMVRRWAMFSGLVVTGLAAAVVIGMVGSAGRLGGAVLFGFGAAAAVLTMVAVVRFVFSSLR